MACIFYFAHCMIIIFNLLLVQLVKYYYNSQNKIHTRYFLSHIIILIIILNY